MEIAGQPDALRRAAVALEDQRETLLALAEAATDGGGVVLTGMGSSYDACFAAVNERAARGCWRSTSTPPSSCISGRRSSAPRPCSWS